MTKHLITQLLCFCTLLMIAIPAHAQVDILPAQSYENKAVLESGETHTPIKLTPDKSELIRLDKKAASVIIGNPAHLSVLAENSQTLVLVPALPGATHITILDEEANVLMRRHIIVASPKERYVRIRKTCRADDDGCRPTSVYFCPDMCHEVNVTQQATESSNTENTTAADQNTQPGGQGSDASYQEPTPQ